MKLVMPALDHFTMALEFNEGAELKVALENNAYRQWCGLVYMDADLFGKASFTYFATNDDESEIIGLVTMRLIKDEILGNVTLSIGTSHRGKGYGTQLLGMVIKRYKDLGYQSVLLNCPSDNEAARKIILKNGGIRTESILTPTIESYSA